MAQVLTAWPSIDAVEALEIDVAADVSPGQPRQVAIKGTSNNEGSTSACMLRR